MVSSEFKGLFRLLSQRLVENYFNRFPLEEMAYPRNQATIPEKAM
jgi:hypothetical protein